MGEVGNGGYTVRNVVRYGRGWEWWILDIQSEMYQGIGGFLTMGIVDTQLKM